MKRQKKRSITSAGIILGSLTAAANPGISQGTEAANKGQDKDSRLNAWSAPNWGFIHPIQKEIPNTPPPASVDTSVAASVATKTISAQKPTAAVHVVAASSNNADASKSLIFDQQFDKTSYRPWPMIAERKIVNERVEKVAIIETPPAKTIASAPVNVAASANAISAPIVPNLQKIAPTQETFIKTAAVKAVLQQPASIVKNIEKVPVPKAIPHVSPVEEIFGQSIQKLVAEDLKKAATNQLPPPNTQETQPTVAPEKVTETLTSPRIAMNQPTKPVQALPTPSAAPEILENKPEASPVTPLVPQTQVTPIAEVDSDSAISGYVANAQAFQRKLKQIDEVLLESTPKVAPPPNKINSDTPSQTQKAKNDEMPKIDLSAWFKQFENDPAPAKTAKKDEPKTATTTSKLSGGSGPMGVESVTPKPQKSIPGEISLSRLQIPKADSALAKLYLVDDESSMNGDSMGIDNAEVSWIGVNSGLVSTSRSGGQVQVPYYGTSSMRFIVRAKGYLPAVGYASAGLVTPVALFKEERLGPVIKSLGVVPDSSRVMVFGKILDSSGKAVPNASIDAAVERPFKVSYSLGNFGLFHSAATSTGPTGEFFISGVRAGLQYFMPTQGLAASTNYGMQDASVKSVEWPAAILNLANVGPIVTVTVQQAEQRKLRTQIVDAFLLERPSDTGIQLTIGGQRGVYIPDQEGFVELPEMYRRSNPDLVEIRAQGYMKTWITGSAEKGSFPENIALFTQRQVDTLLAEALPQLELTKGIVFGNLRAEKFKSGIQIRVFDSSGKKAPNAKILYFDEKNIARGKLTETDPVVQNFAVANLSGGEWQLIAVDTHTGKAVGAQIVRVEDGTISQVQF